VRLVVLWSSISFLIAGNPFYRHDPKEHKKHFIEQINLTNKGANEFLHYQKMFPKIKILPSLNGDCLTLIASNEEDLLIMKDFIMRMDIPTEIINLTLYCLLIKEQYLDDFFSTLLTPYQLSHLSWSDVLVAFLGEMQREGSLVIVAAPKLSMQVGKNSFLKASEEFYLKTNNLLGKEDKKQFGIELNISCTLKPQKTFSFDINMLHYSIPLGSGPHQQMNKDQLETSIDGKRGDILFLGSIGRWSQIEEGGHYRLLNFLPKAMNPYPNQELKISSQMIVLAHIE